MEKKHPTRRPYELINTVWFPEIHRIGHDKPVDVCVQVLLLVMTL